MLVPGQAFLYDTTIPCPYVRLTFSKIPEKDMQRAAEYLAAAIRDEQKIARKLAEVGQWVVEESLDRNLYLCHIWLIPLGSK